MQRGPRPSIAVVVVGCNSARWLPECLRGLSDNGAQGVCLIYVDNASEDDSVSVARTFGDVHVIRHGTNRGFGHACNAGARFARVVGADVIVFLNPDTRASVATIMACGEYLRKHESVGVVGPLQVEYGSGEERPNFNVWTRRAVRCEGVYPLDHHKSTPLSAREFDERRRTQSELIDVWYVNGGAMAMREEVFRACGGFDTGYFLFFEDVDMCRKVRWLGYRVGLHPGLLVEHAWGGHDEGDRRRAWMTSKYHFLLSDPSLKATARLSLVGAELLKDVGVSLRGPAMRRDALLVLASLLHGRTAIRASRQGNTRILGTSAA